MGYGYSVAMICGVGLRCSSDLALLCLWCRPAAAAPVQPLAWELPYAVDVALKRKKKMKILILFFIQLPLVKDEILLKKKKIILSFGLNLLLCMCFTKSTVLLA